MSGTAKDILIRELKDTISDQKEMIATLRAALDASTSQSRELTVQIKNLTEQVEYLKRKLFGTSSERRDKNVEGQISLFNEAEQENDSARQSADVEVKPHTRKKKQTLEEKIKGIPVERVVMDLTDDEKECPWCRTPLEYLGEEVVRHELEYIPAKVKVIEYVSKHYICPECKESDEPYIAKAKGLEPLMKHSLASPSSVAWVMYQKYANGLPLYRQEKDWKESGIELSRATMANWIIHCALQYMKPLYDYCREELLKRTFAMADETRVQVLNEPNRKAQTDSFMWLFRSGEDGLPPIILYKYSQTRAGETAKDFLEGFQGYLMADGYTGYNKVPGVKRCSCFAHIRRYFIEAVPKNHEYDYTKPAVQGVEYCTKLFKYEETFRNKGYSHEKLKEARLRYEKPVLEAFLCWLKQQNPIRNSRLDKAVTYTLNRADDMMTYLEDGRCSFTNNASERGMKSFVIGRKGWLFCDTPSGAEASAIVYSMVEMAKENNINIHRYLKYLLEARPNENMVSEELAKLVPWSDETKKVCGDTTA